MYGVEPIYTGIILLFMTLDYTCEMLATDIPQENGS